MSRNYCRMVRHRSARCCAGLPAKNLGKHGAAGWDWTTDLFITNEVLYHW